MAEITTVIFDLSEVLLRGMLGAERYISQVVGAPVTHAQLKVQELDGLFRGRITEDAYWKAVIEQNKWPRADKNRFKEAIRKNFREIRGTRAVIEKVRWSGYQLGLLSVNGMEWTIFCETMHRYEHLFDTVSYSCDTGFCKPEFQANFGVLRELGVTPGESVLVDDKLVNVCAARRLGMQGIRFLSAWQAERDLRKIGVQI